jgi:hypothetical protein
MPRSKHPGVLSVWEKAKHLRVRDGELRATQSQKILKGDSHIPSRSQNGSAVILTLFFIPWGYDWKTKGVLNVPPSFRVEKAPKAPTVIISQVSETISTQSPAASGCVRKRETPNTEALGLYVSGGFECNGDLLYWTSANRRFRGSD